MAELARLVVALEAQTAKYEKKLDAANRKLDRFARQQKTALNSIKSAFLSLGTAVSAIALTNMIRQSVQAADSAAKLSQQIGISVEALTGLKLGVELGGAQLEDLNKGLTRLARAASDAGNGLATQKRAFDDLGVSVMGANGQLRPVESILRDISDAFSTMENGTRKAARAQELFGRSGAMLIPFLNEGSKGLDAIIQRSERLGVVWSTEAAAGAEQFDDNLLLLTYAAKGFSTQITQGLLPTLTGLSAIMVDLAENSSLAAKAVSGIKAIFVPIATGALVLGDGLETLAKRIAALAASATLLFRGDFDGIKTVIDKFNSDTEARFAKTVERIKALNGELTRELAKGSGPVQSTYVPGATFVGESDKEASARLKILSDMADFNDELVDQTRERVLKQRELQRESLEPFVMTTRESADDFDNVVFGKFDKMKEQADAFQKTFADNLVMAVDSGFDGILKSWTRTLLQMAARAASSKIFALLSQGSGGGLVGAIGGLFGGARAAGGPVSGGRSYLVGEKGPELFMPRGSGNIARSGSFGGTNITVNAPNSAPGMEIRIRQAVSEAVRLSSQDRNDSRRRGR